MNLDQLREILSHLEAGERIADEDFESYSAEVCAGVGGGRARVVW